MSSQTAKSQDVYVPPELPGLLEDFAVAVLREQPENITEFGVQFFTHLNLERKNSSAIKVGFVASQFSRTDDWAHGHGKAKEYGAKRKSVAAEKYDPAQDNEDELEALNDDKTSEQVEMLMNSVAKIFLFESLDETMRRKVVMALQMRHVTKDEDIIVQGEPGDYFYIIESGQYAVFVRQENQKKGLGDRVTTLDGEGSFGELALMYNQPRSATIRAETDGVLWALGRQTFNRIVIYGSYRRRLMFTEVLEKMPMLKPLSAEDRNKLVDAMIPRTVPDGTVIISQGNPDADCMYFIEHGEISIRVETGGIEKEIKELKVGDYFGERALITREPRQASAVAVGPVALMELQVDAFERFLGPCKDLMEKNAQNYESQITAAFKGSHKGSPSKDPSASRSHNVNSAAVKTKNQRSEHSLPPRQK